ncbi:MAG: T9SS type A sorting domain-containing protein, partial [Flavobacteriales bacterium]|nr:T9SS type A sorting domain-containing protein [Flavobacteriales bacterium]
ERYENNNRSSRTFTLSIPKPDLRVSAKSLTPHTIAPGEDLDLTATIKNFGNGHALNTSNLKYFLSTNSSYSSNDILLDQSTISALGTNSDETAKKTVTIPTSTTDGTRYIIFYADHDDDVDESNESNNWTSLSFKVHTPEPDLVVEKIDLDQSGYYQGDAMSIDVTVKNIGDWAAGSSEVKVYLSSNSSLGSTDFFIGSGSISSLQSGDDDIHTHSFTIPNTVGNGKWYIIAKCDADDDVAEDNENNNVRAQIFDVFPDKPDLKPISISISPNANNLTAGQSVNLSATVKNIGSANAGSSWVDYYLSTDSIYSSNDIYMDYDYLPALNAGDDYDIIDNFFLPSNITGNMYLLVAVDVYDNRVNESNEGNNVISLPVVISSSGAGKMANEDGSIPNQELQFEFETFPNPFSQILNIDLKNISDHNSFINILDARGKVVHQQTGNTNRITIDLSELSKGMYTLQVINNGQVKNDRIIKH